MAKKIVKRKTTPSQSTYGFRLKFHVPAGSAFKGVHPTRRLRFATLGGRVYLVKLRGPRRHRFGAVVRYSFRGTQFRRHQAATDCGRRLKRALSLFAAEKRIGLDAGSDKATSGVSQIIKDDFARRFNVQVRDEVHGLDVYREDRPITRFGVEAYGTTSRIIDYEGALEKFFAMQLAFTEKQELALDLYNLTHFEDKPKTRFLTLITVIEVLATRRARSLAAKSRIQKLQEVLRRSGLSDDEREAIRNGLNNLKIQSIKEACRQFVARYSPSNVAFFVKCYNARSELVHSGKAKREEDVNASRLDELVATLLIVALTGSAK